MYFSRANYLFGNRKLSYDRKKSIHIENMLTEKVHAQGVCQPKCPVCKCTANFVYKSGRYASFEVLSNTLSLSPIRHILRNVYTVYAFSYILSLIAGFMGPAWGPSGADRTQVGPMLATWTLLSGVVYHQSILPLRVSGNYHMIAQVRFFSRLKDFAT